MALTFNVTLTMRIATPSIILLALFIPLDSSAQPVSSSQQLPPLRGPFISNYTRSTYAQETERYTTRGAIIGGIAGTVVGLGIGAFIALLCEAESDGCGGAIPIVGAIGLVSGAIGGAIIGAAIPRSPRGTDEPVTAQRRIGSFGIAVGGAAAKLEDWSGNELFEGGGMNVRANLYAELKPWFAIGPEVGQAWLSEGGRIRHAAVALRMSYDATPIAPHVALNLGAYQSTLPSLEYLGGGIAAGARIAPRNARLFFDVEARHSRNAQNIEPMRMNTITAGIGTYW